eukprot:5736546-Alexandrium_andersonii.AAC.1
MQRSGELRGLRGLHLQSYRPKRLHRQPPQATQLLPSSPGLTPAPVWIWQLLGNTCHQAVR